MSKTSLKTRKMKTQNGIGAMSGETLPEDMSLVDTDRIVLRMNGGGYEEDNYRIDTPLAHMERHGTLRVRVPPFDELKNLMDDFRQMQKLRVKINNQVLATKRHTDEISEETEKFLLEEVERVEDAETERGKKIEGWIKRNKTLPIVSAIMSVKGVGKVTAANLLVDIDITKADHPSSLWAYIGYDKPSIDRYKKGKMGGGNKPLRCAMFVMAECFLKCQNQYAMSVYYPRKTKLENSDRIVRERAKGDGRIVEIEWKNAMPIHRHLDAFRVMIKHYLADLWFVWRTLEGLPVTDLYVKEHLGHESAIINPKAMGWKY